MKLQLLRRPADVVVSGKVMITLMPSQTKVIFLLVACLVVVVYFCYSGDEGRGPVFDHKTFAPQLRSSSRSLGTTTVQKTTISNLIKQIKKEGEVKGSAPRTSLSGSSKPKTAEVSPASLSPSPKPLIGNSRVYYEWNMSVNILETKYLSLPPEAPSVSKPEFFTTFYPISPENPLIDHSQGQLVDLLDIFDRKNNGIYIDLAANAWADGSNTVDLDHYFNWTGICIEPNRKYWMGILSNRKCTLVTSPVFSEENVMVKFFLNDGLGGIVAQGFDNERATRNIVEMPTVTLQRVIDNILPKIQSKSLHVHSYKAADGKTVNIFDYLSLDVEGAEYPALSHFDFNHTIFHVMTIERPKPILHMLLVRNGYWWLNQGHGVAVNGGTAFGDMIYLHHTAPRFLELMNKYRANPRTSYRNNRRSFNAAYLMRPAWPPEGSLSSNEVLKVDDILNCGPDQRQIYLWRGGQLHGIPSMEVFGMIGNGQRSFDELITLHGCQGIPVGIDVSKENVKVDASDAIWTTKIN